MPNQPETFRKKPVEIQAMRWDGTAEGATPIIDWILNNGWMASYVCSDPDRCVHYDGDTPHGIVIRTYEGDMTATVGDWVIRGTEGEFYPCKPAPFAAAYERVTRATGSSATGGTAPYPTAVDRG